MDRFENHVNKTIDGRYQIKNVVGIGGMAYVLKADDLLANRTVAIKILNDELNSDEQAVKRFINESKAVSMLSNHNIVTVYDVAINEDFKYIVMEYIDGITLKDYIDKKGVLEWREAVHYTLQILEGLSHAHEKGIIHRDIKPQNVMLLKDGTIKVTDFGIAKIANNESITVTDKAIGTVNYISPEQASGSSVDAQSDLYSVGVMLYEMVTKKLPFISDSPVAVATMHVSSIPKSPREVNPQIPVGLEQIILKAMSKEPGLRFSSADAMRKAIMFLVENPSVVFSERGTEKTGQGAPSARGDEKRNIAGATRAKGRGRQKGGRSMLPIISGVTFAFFLAGLLFILLFVGRVMGRDGNNYTAGENDNENFAFSFIGKLFSGDKGENAEITIPALVGRQYSDLLNDELSDTAFRITNVKYISDDELEKDLIVSQEPEANAVRKLSPAARYYAITVTVNKGASNIEMPRFELLSYNVARTELINLGFNRNNVVRQDVFNDTIVDGYVIRSEPEAGRLVDVTRDTKITLFVSKGRQIETTLVPELKNLSVEQAKKAIVESKLSIGSVILVVSDIPAGTVLKASKNANTVVPEKLTKIDLYVSMGGGDHQPGTHPPGAGIEEPEDSQHHNNRPSTDKPDGDFTGFTIDEDGNFVFTNPAVGDAAGAQNSANSASNGSATGGGAPNTANKPASGGGEASPGNAASASNGSASSGAPNTANKPASGGGETSPGNAASASNGSAAGGAPNTANKPTSGGGETSPGNAASASNGSATGGGEAPPGGNSPDTPVFSPFVLPSFEETPRIGVNYSRSTSRLPHPSQTLSVSATPSPASPSQTLSVSATPSPASLSQTLSVSATPSPASPFQTLSVSATSSPASLSQTLSVSATPSPASPSQTLSVSATPSPASLSQTLSVSATSSPASLSPAAFSPTLAPSGAEKPRSRDAKTGEDA